MNTPQARSSGAPISLATLVGCPCRLTRVGDCYDGRGTLAVPGLDGQLLRCPQVGKPLWLLIDQRNWVRTSPVVAISTESDRGGVVVFVRTGDARYSFAFPSLSPVADRSAA
jgi:hypothetical protein